MKRNKQRTLQPLQRPKRRWLRRLMVGCSITLFVSLLLLVGLGVLIYQGLNQFRKELSATLVQEALPTLIKRAPEVDIAAPVVPLWTEPQSYTGQPFTGQAFPFSADKPTVIVLLHGATRTPQPDRKSVV